MSTQHHESNFRARQLGRELARLRDLARLTQEDAGQRVRFSGKKMSRLEKGQIPDFNGYRALLGIYRVPMTEFELYVRMWERAKEKGWWHGSGADDLGYIGLEHYASAVLTYQLAFVPALLQTPDYARESLRGRTPEDVDRNVSARQRRQERLTSEEPLRLHAVVDEIALRVPMAPGVQEAQLRFLLQQARLDTVTVQVVPTAVGNHRGLSGPFTLLTFDGDGQQDTVHTEAAFGAALADGAEQVESARSRFRELAGLALREAESLALIERIADAR